MRENLKPDTWFLPLPVLVIGTYDEEGRPNAMNAAWGGVCDYKKVIISLDPHHKTTKNILSRKAFTLAFADKEHLVQADYVGLVSGNKVPDKVEKAGLTPLRASTVDAPLFDEFPLSLECKLLEVTKDGCVIGSVESISADERIIGPDGKVDSSRFTPLSFDPVRNVYRLVGEDAGPAFKAGLKLKK